MGGFGYVNGIVATSCAVAGAVIGNLKGYTVVGFLIGPVLGPLGVLLLLFGEKWFRPYKPGCKTWVRKEATSCDRCGPSFPAGGADVQRD
jgi:hypothetical protein